MYLKKGVNKENYQPDLNVNIKKKNQHYKKQRRLKLIQRSKCDKM